MLSAAFFLLTAAGSVVPSATALHPITADAAVGYRVNDATAAGRKLQVTCTAPSTISGMTSVLEASKLNAPTSHEQVDDPEGYCDKYFYKEGSYMRFMTDDERSELRIPADDDEKDGFIVEEATASLDATLKLEAPSIGESEHYTWMQVHGEDTSYIRLAHYGSKEGLENHLWLFIKEGSSSSNELTSMSMGAVPTGDFSASIKFPGDGTVTVSVNGQSEEFNIVWSDTQNYFKAGVYVQNGNPSDFLVDYKTLTYSLSSGVNYL